MPIPKPRRLSKKKIRKSITLPEYLDDWIKRYLKYERDQEADKGNHISDEIKSFSSFIAAVLEKSMNLFLKGKTLEDLDRAADTRTKKFYDKITFRSLIIYYELIVNLHKYQELNLSKMLNIFMMVQNFFTGGKTITEEDAILTLSRFRNFMIDNNTTKDIMIERSGDKYIFQYFGIYPEMHYDFSKAIAGVLGFLGIRINKVSHSNNYTRIDFKLTDLFKDATPALDERKRLFENNTEFFTNFNKILEDQDDIHLWIKVNKSNHAIISFKNVEDGLIAVREIIEDLNKWISPREFKLKLLNLFSKFRWINQVNESHLSFNLLVEKNSTEYNIMKMIISELKLNFDEFDNTLYLP